MDCISSKNLMVFGIEKYNLLAINVIYWNSRRWFNVFVLECSDSNSFCSVVDGEAGHS